MGERREPAGKSESDERMDGETSARDPEREKERQRGSARAGESTSWKETDRGDARRKESQRVLTKLTGADLRRNLTNSGLNPPTRAVDLSCLPLNLAAVLAGWTRRWILFFFLFPVDLSPSFSLRCTAFPLLGSFDYINGHETSSTRWRFPLFHLSLQRRNLIRI